MAIASLVVSIVGMVFLICYGVGGLIAPVGAILGHVARKQIRERQESGDGMALAGVIVGWIGTGLGLIVLAFIVAGDRLPDQHAQHRLDLRHGIERDPVLPLTAPLSGGAPHQPGGQEDRDRPRPCDPDDDRERLVQKQPIRGTASARSPSDERDGPCSDPARPRRRRARSRRSRRPPGARRCCARRTRSAGQAPVGRPRPRSAPLRGRPRRCPIPSRP